MRRVRTLLAIAGLSLGTWRRDRGGDERRDGWHSLGAARHVPRRYERAHAVRPQRRQEEQIDLRRPMRDQLAATADERQAEGQGRCEVERPRHDQARKLRAGDLQRAPRLYYDLADTVAGDLAGQGTKVGGGTWTVIGPNGSPITSTGKSAPQGKY